jgi:hypothetical protein
MMKALPTGFTDNSVTQVDGLVIKTGKDVHKELEWYEAYQDKADIPIIVGGYAESCGKSKSIVMEYVERSGTLRTQEIMDIIRKYKKYPALNSLGSLWYYHRIGYHLVKNENITNGMKLLDRLSIMVIEPTFSHGDLSVYNIIPTSTGLKLIDPLYYKDTFGSYILDYAKLLFSLKFYNNDMKMYDELRALSGIVGIDVLIAAECVRVATYKKQFSFIAENLINEL